MLVYAGSRFEELTEGQIQHIKAKQHNEQKLNTTWHVYDLKFMLHMMLCG
jgi:hypothetical protein